VIHEAFIYSSDDEFVAALAPFLGEAVEAGDTAVAVTTPARFGLLREALAGDAASISFFDSAEWYQRPGATLSAWRSLLDERLRDGARFVRVVGELPFTSEHERWTRYESLVNRALADVAGWVICAYDAQRLPDAVLAGARRTHPIVSTGGSRAPSAEHFTAGDLAATLVAGVDRAAVEEGPAARVSPEGDCGELRKKVVWAARRAGLAGDVVEDLLLALEEILSSVFASGRRTAIVRTARAGGEWLCELAATGRAAGDLPPDAGSLGFVVARLICERVEVTDDEERLVVRLVFGTPRQDARQRLLTAAAELFGTTGVRATGVNAIIARAGVAKATFYSHFRSKDELVQAWLEGPTTRWFEGVRAEVDARAETPQERLVLLFDVLAEWLEANGYVGCGILKAAAEDRDGDGPAGRALGAIKNEIGDYLRGQAAEAGLEDPADLASQLFVLVIGTIAGACLEHSGAAAANARAAAARLVS
jgi:AcrR family transcriptional regulator